MKIPFVLSVLLLVPAITTAQPVPRVQVRAAVGASNYLHGDLDYVAPTLLVSVRAGGRAVVIEPEYAAAWHSTDDQFVNGRVRQRSRFDSVGVNLIRRWPGRIEPFIGGGVGIYAEHFHRETTLAILEGTTIADRTAGPRPGAQVVGGLDVRLSPRFSAFAQGRYELRSFNDPGGSSVVQGLAGLAIAVW